MLFTADMIDALKAKEIWLICSYFQIEELTKETMVLANKIASKSSMTISMGKKAFYSQSDLDLSSAYDYTSQVMVENLLKGDAKEGIGAFIEKRPAKWTDK